MTAPSQTRPILIAGPTASGKSALAIALARRLNGVILNADSQQIYREWQILSARPTAQDIVEAPHRLFGHIGIADPYSVGHWLSEIKLCLKEIRRTQQRPIIVGGTGLYFKALTEGLAPIPAVPPEIRETGEAALKREGLAAFAKNLAARDPETARALDLDNPRRVLRAWEVLEATGTGLAGWKARTPAPLVPLATCIAIALTPPRDALHQRCEVRFDQMMEAGALDEVRAVDALGLSGDLPGLKAIGAAPLRLYLAGEIARDAAVVQAKTETRRYAKRQLTWIRNQMSNWQRLESADTESAMAIIAP